MKNFVLSLFVAFTLLTFALPTTLLAADWEPCYGGLLRCDDNGIIWQKELVTGENQVAQLSSSDDAFSLVRNISTFINGPVIILLFSIALLFFIFNAARYFIIEATNADKKAEAKQSTLYGIAALVILVSIWGIVNVIVSSLKIDSDQSICPDYFTKFGINCQGDLSNFDGGTSVNLGGRPGTSGGNFNSGAGGGNPGSGSGSGTASGNGSLPTNPNGTTASKIGRLVYGDLSDSSNFNFRAGTPRAQTNTVLVAADASCESGLSTLSLATGVETSQASYMMYKNASGATQFKNLTDITTASSIDIDADTYNDITTKSQPTIIHTHPKKTTAKAGLTNLNGHPPSLADMKLLCDNVADNATYLVLDGTNVWSMTKTAGSCPRTISQADSLQTIETLLLLSLLPGADRLVEYDSLMKAGDIPSLLKTNLTQYQNSNLGGLSNNDTFLIADNLARAGAMQIRKQSTSEFCASY